MNDKKKIVELERQLAQANPTHVDLLKLNGVPQKIVGQKKLVDVTCDWQKIDGKWRRMNLVPLIQVVERVPATYETKSPSK